MYAANGIFGLSPHSGGSDLLTSHRFRNCIYALILEGGGVAALILDGGGVATDALILEGGGVATDALILEGGGVAADAETCPPAESDANCDVLRAQTNLHLKMFVIGVNFLGFFSPAVHVSRRLTFAISHPL